jgi:hypothetical protein
MLMYKNFTWAPVLWRKASILRLTSSITYLRFAISLIVSEIQAKGRGYHDAMQEVMYIITCRRWQKSWRSSLSPPSILTAPPPFTMPFEYADNYYWQTATLFPKISANIFLYIAHEFTYYHASNLLVLINPFILQGIAGVHPGYIAHLCLFFQEREPGKKQGFSVHIYLWLSGEPNCVAKLRLHATYWTLQAKLIKLLVCWLCSAWLLSGLPTMFELCRSLKGSVLDSIWVHVLCWNCWEDSLSSLFLQTEVVTGNSKS